MADFRRVARQIIISTMRDQASRVLLRGYVHRWKSSLPQFGDWVKRREIGECVTRGTTHSHGHDVFSENRKRHSVIVIVTQLRCFCIAVVALPHDFSSWYCSFATLVSLFCSVSASARPKQIFGEIVGVAGGS